MFHLFISFINAFEISNHIKLFFSLSGSFSKSVHCAKGKLNEMIGLNDKGASISGGGDSTTAPTDTNAPAANGAQLPPPPPPPSTPSSTTSTGGNAGASTGGGSFGGSKFSS